MLRKLTTNVMMLALLLPATGCIVFPGRHGASPRVWAEGSEVLTFPREGVSGVDVQTHNGSIHADALADSEPMLRVRVNRRAGGASQEEAESNLAAMEIVSKRTAEGVVRVAWRWRDMRNSYRHARVDYEVEMPPELPFKGETHNGSVLLRGVGGDVAVLTHNGGVAIADHGGGRVSARTHNGSVEVRTSARDVDLETHNGRVGVELTGAGPVDGKVVSHNGRVRVETALERTFRLSASTDNGGVTVGVPLSKLEARESRVQGQFGDGEGMLLLRTHNGSIRVEALTE